MLVAGITSCGGSETYSGILCWGSRLRESACWINVTAMSGGQPLRREMSEFLLLGPCTLGWIHASVFGSGSQSHLGSLIQDRGLRGPLHLIGIQRLAVREREVPLTAAGVMHPWKWIS